MQEEDIRKMCRDLSKALSNKKVVKGGLPGIGAKMGTIISEYLEPGFEESDFDEFLFGLLNSVRTEVHDKDNKISTRKKNEEEIPDKES